MKALVDASTGRLEAGAEAAAASEVDETLAESLRSFARSLRQSSAESLSQWDITPSQSRVFRVLGRHGLIRLSELSEHLRIAPRSTTDVVDSLEQRGLLERRPDPHDRRATQVTLTAAGAKLAEEIRQARGAEAERAFDKLSAADRDHLARILRQLRD